MIWSSAKPQNVRSMLKAISLLPLPPPTLPLTIEEKKQRKKARARALAWTGFSEEEPEEWNGISDSESAVATVKLPGQKPNSQVSANDDVEEWHGISEESSAPKVKLPKSQRKATQEAYPEEWHGIEHQDIQEQDGPARTGSAEEPPVGKLNESVESLAITQEHPPLVAVWARDRLNLSATDFNRKVQTVKDLKQVWEEIEGDWDQSNTVLVDDAVEKAVSLLTVRIGRLRVPTDPSRSAYNLTTSCPARLMTLTTKI